MISYLIATRTVSPGCRGTQQANFSSLLEHQQNCHMKWSFTLIMHDKIRISLKCPIFHKCNYLHLILNVMDSFCTTAIYFTFYISYKSHCNTGHSTPEYDECSCTQILLCLILLQCGTDLARVPKVGVSMLSP